MSLFRYEIIRFLHNSKFNIIQISDGVDMFSELCSVVLKNPFLFICQNIPTFSTNFQLFIIFLIYSERNSEWCVIYLE